MSLFEYKKPQAVLFRIALGLGLACMTIGLAAFAYLGTFTRYLADDYCEAVLVTKSSPFNAVINRYIDSQWRAADRYSNLLFDGLSELLLPGNVASVPAIMIVLWTAALTWLAYEIRRKAGLQWSLLIDFFLAATTAFFTILQTANRFQTIYWRSSMSTHFAPIVYLTFFAAFLLMLIRRPLSRAVAFWLSLLCLVVAFFGGGFSEPPDAVLITAAALALAAFWRFEQGPGRRPALRFLGWTLAGGLLALVVMVLSVINSSRTTTPRLDFVYLISHTFLYTVLFVLDALRTLPLPTLLSVGIPYLLFFSLFSAMPSLSSVQRRMIWIFLVATPILAFLLIAASFSPSVYGQSFPVERARFTGRFLLTAACILEGVYFGVICAQWRARRSQSLLMYTALVLLLLTAVYPLRAARAALQGELANYQSWSSAWDIRQQHILGLKAQGQQDLVVPQLPGISQIKELDTNPDFWVNRCAAAFYGVKSISAPPMHP